MNDKQQSNSGLNQEQQEDPLTKGKKAILPIKELLIDSLQNKQMDVTNYKILQNNFYLLADELDHFEADNISQLEVSHLNKFHDLRKEIIQQKNKVQHFLHRLNEGPSSIQDGLRNKFKDLQDKFALLLKELDIKESYTGKKFIQHLKHNTIINKQEPDKPSVTKNQHSDSKKGIKPAQSIEQGLQISIGRLSLFSKKAAKPKTLNPEHSINPKPRR